MGSKFSLGDDSFFMSQITKYNWSIFPQIQSADNIKKLINGIDKQKSNCCPQYQCKCYIPGSQKSGAIYKFNKSFYVGEIKNQQANGMGVILLKDLTAFKGNFEQSRPHGNGSLYDSTSQLIQQGKWLRGSFLKGKIIMNNQLIIDVLIQNDDRFTINYRNGSKYVGEGLIKDSMFYRHGKGKFTIPLQYEYYGDWKMNKREGKASVKSKNYSFNGYYKNDAKQSGKLEANNYQYDGVWDKQLFTGEIINKVTKGKNYIRQNVIQNRR